jgi:hypothetical protein
MHKHKTNIHVLLSWPSPVRIVDTDLKEKWVSEAIQVQYMFNLSAIVSIVVNNQKPNLDLNAHMFKCHLSKL